MFAARRIRIGLATTRSVTTASTALISCCRRHQSSIGERRWSTFSPGNGSKRVAVAHQPIIESRRRVPDAAKNSPDGLCRQAAVGLPVFRAVVTAMAISAAPPAFQHAESSGTELRALDSWVRHRPSRHATNPTCDSDVGTRPAYWFIKLARLTGGGRCHRNVYAHGLRLLVVALGEPYD